MTRIAIELNHVIRNINRQLLKYYQKEYKPSLDIEEIDEKSDVINEVLEFDSKSEKNTFMFIDYPFEIFGAAKAMSKTLVPKLAKWSADLEDVYDGDVELVFYSLGESALSIQSSFFFLSKIGCRARKVMMPTDVMDVMEYCDVVVTANPNVVAYPFNDVKKVLVRMPWNTESEDFADLVYDSFDDIMDDENFINKVRKETPNIN